MFLFGKSSTKIGNLCTPTYKFIWRPGKFPGNFRDVKIRIGVTVRQYDKTGSVFTRGLDFSEKKTKNKKKRHFSGYWKATGPNKFIGRGTQVADFCRGFSKGNFPKNPGGKKKTKKTLATGRPTGQINS